MTSTTRSRISIAATTSWVSQGRTGRARPRARRRTRRGFAGLAGSGTRGGDDRRCIHECFAVCSRKRNEGISELRASSPRPPLDLGKVLGQPTLHRFGILLIRPPQRPLRLSPSRCSSRDTELRLRCTPIDSRSVPAPSRRSKEQTGNSTAEESCPDGFIDPPHGTAVEFRRTPAALRASNFPQPPCRYCVSQRKTVRRFTPNAAATLSGLSPACTAATPRLRSSVRVVWSSDRPSVFMTKTIPLGARDGHYYGKVNTSRASSTYPTASFTTSMRLTCCPPSRVRSTSWIGATSISLVCMCCIRPVPSL